MKTDHLKISYARRSTRGWRVSWLWVSRLLCVLGLFLLIAAPSKGGGMEITLGTVSMVTGILGWLFCWAGAVQ